MSSIVLTGDTSGTITVSAPAVAGTRTLTLPAATGTAILEDASGVLQMNSGYGSLAPAYGCRAWVNFNGTSTVAIRESGNVSSITDNGTGDYTVNFTTAMPDANYCASVNSEFGAASGSLRGGNADIYSTTSVTIQTFNVAGGTPYKYDMTFNNVAIFR